MNQRSNSCLAGALKEKQGDTPTKGRAGVVVAADQLPVNGHKQSVDLDELEAGTGKA